jgi:hypothetical protein
MKGEHSPSTIEVGPDTKQSLSVHRESEGESSGIPLKPQGTPGQGKERIDLDFLPRCAREIRVCAFH